MREHPQVDLHMPGLACHSCCSGKGIIFENADTLDLPKHKALESSGGLSLPADTDSMAFISFTLQFV